MRTSRGPRSRCGAGSHGAGCRGSRAHRSRRPRRRGAGTRSRGPRRRRAPARRRRAAAPAGSPPRWPERGAPTRRGWAARPSAQRATRRTPAEPVPRARAAACRRPGSVTDPLRSAESATASASSNGSTRVQSTTVRRGVVTPPRTSPSGRSAQCGSRPARWWGRRRLDRGRVTQAAVGGVLTFHPWWSAALRWESVAVRAAATPRCSATWGSAYRPRAVRSTVPRRTALRNPCGEWRAVSSDHVAQPPRAARVALTDVTPQA